MAKSIRKAGERSLRRAASPQFLLRVGGLPINAIDELRFEKTMQWINAVLSLESLFILHKEKLVDAIHEAVNKNKENQAHRRRLIHLKRDIFNLRMLSDIEGTRELAASLSKPENVLLEEWADLWDRYRQLLADGSTIFQQELQQKRALLKQVIETPDFRKGILLASPDLDQAISSYLASDHLQLNRAARTTERSLVEYLLRTACKTSPFSTFTAVCQGAFDTVGILEEKDFLYEIDPLDKQSFTRLNMAFLSKLSSLILACDTIKADLPVRLTPGWHIHNNRIRYLRRMQGRDDRNEDAPIALDVVHENVFYLPVARLLGVILEVMRNGRVARLGEILHELCSKPEYTGAEREITLYLEHLLRLGLLIIPHLHLSIHDEYPLTSYRQGLLAMGIPTTRKIADYLGIIDELVTSYNTASPARRRELFDEIKQQAKKCYAELGQSQAPIPRTLVYEDTTLQPQKLAINMGTWGNVLTSVSEFQQVLPALDINLPRRLVTKGYFQARYGVGQRCDDFLAFAYEFRRDFFEYYLQRSGMQQADPIDTDDKLPRHVNSFHQPEIEMLDNARQAVADAIKRAYEQLPSGSKELVLEDDFIRTVVSHIPPNCERLASHSLFSQFARVDDEPLLIVNRIYAGLTLMFSRFAHFFNAEKGSELVPQLRATLKQLQPHQAVFAEFKGGHEATNLNLHPQVTEYELVCPGDLSTRPENEQIPLEDLSIHDDEEGLLRLYSKRLGKEVIPLYLGFLVPAALPEIQQVLLNFSYATMCPIDLWTSVKKSDEQAKIEYYPRLRYKNIVLQRAQWKIRSDFFPQHKPGQSDADFYLSVVRWGRENRLPSRVFIAPATSSSPPKLHGVDEKLDQPVRTYKPMYVDFKNFFSVNLLESAIRGAGNHLIISEMLPHYDQLWLKHHGQSYISEFVWEMNALDGGQCDQELDEYPHLLCQ